MDAHTRFDTQIVGALPVITRYFDRLELGAIIDDLVPWEGDVPLGTLVEIFIANRLLEPKALFRIGTWAGKAGLTDYYAVTPEQLNDDRLGRALERVAEHAEAIQAGLVVKAIKRFKLDVTQIHYDITDVELYGAYEMELAEGEIPPTPMPTYGRTKSGRKNVKQIQAGLNVTSDGGVPVGHSALDGNAAESKTHIENLRLLGRTLPKGKLLYIADTKLDTSDNLLAVAARKGHFLCGGAFYPHMQEMYLKLRQKMHKVNYFPQSQAQRAPEERDKYLAMEIPETIEGVVDGRTVRLKYRVVFVWSEAKARQEATTRERHTAKIREEFEAVQRNLGKFSLKTEEAIVRRLEKVKARYAAGELFVYQLAKTRRGDFNLTWKIDTKVLQRRKYLEGVYVLKTDLPKTSHPMAKVLRTYKQQSCVERRFHHLKGPLAVAPMFLKNPKRMAGLLCILVWALLVLALMEREVRRGLKGKPLYGLYPENRPSPAPTGPALLDCFGTLCIVIIKDHGTVSRRLAQPTPIQQTLLRLLGVPPDRLRTFKRRCGM
jgi:transposase